MINLCRLPRLSALSGGFQKAKVHGVDLLFFTRLTTTDEEVVEVLAADDQKGGKWTRATIESVIKSNAIHNFSVKEMMILCTLFGEEAMSRVVKVDLTMAESRPLTQRQVDHWKQSASQDLFAQKAMCSLRGPVALELVTTIFEQYLNEREARKKQARKRKTEFSNWREVADVFGQTFRFKRAGEGAVEQVFLLRPECGTWVETSEGEYFDRMTSLEMFQESGRVRIRARDLRWIFALLGGKGMQIVQKVLSQLLHPSEYLAYGLEFEHVTLEEVVQLPDDVQEIYAKLQMRQFSAIEGPVNEANKRLLMNFQKFEREQERVKRQKNKQKH